MYKGGRAIPCDVNGTPISVTGTSLNVNISNAVVGAEEDVSSLLTQILKELKLLNIYAAEIISSTLTTNDIGD